MSEVNQEYAAAFRGSPMSKLELKVPPVLVVFAVAALMYGVAQVLPQIGLEHDNRLALRFIFIAFAGFLGITAVISFRKARTTVNPASPRRTSRLVTTGIYHFTRNPMYLGLAWGLIAWGVHLDSYYAIACVWLFVSYITRFQIIPEERILASSFTDEYSKYCRRTRRWV